MIARNPTRRSPTLAIALAAAFGLTGCSIEINVESAGDDHTHDAVEAPEAPRVDAEAPMPTTPPAVRAPVVPPAPPAVEDPAESAVRDALLRYRDELPPPPQPAKKDLREAPTFTPFTVAPTIVNREAVVDALQREYPPLLKDAGIGGTVRVYFFIEANGTVSRVLLDDSSGHPALDAAAMRVADVYRFSPAKNRTEEVPVWVSFPITFQIR